MAHNEAAYYPMDDDEDLEGDWDDSLQINWMILSSRVVSLILLLVVIVCAGLGLIQTRFLFLAGFVMAGFCLCFGLSFLDCCKKRCTTVHVSRFSFSTPPPTGHPIYTETRRDGEINA